jgi:hypothetical protein
MIVPMFLGAENLVDILSGKLDHVLIDTVNYHHAGWQHASFALSYSNS